MPASEMFLNVEPSQVISRYQKYAAAGQVDTINYLFKSRHLILHFFGIETFKEMAINYRILFNRRKRTRIIDEYQKYLLTKSKQHKSDLVISYHMITIIKVEQELEERIVNFMFERLYERLSNEHDKLDQMSQLYFLKKHLVLEYVKKNLLTRKPV